MNFNTIKFFLVLLTLVSTYFAQDINQKVAIKEFKPGTYKNWVVKGGYSTVEDGTRDISFNYDDNGDVNMVLVGTSEYPLSFVDDYYDNKLITGTHFANDRNNFNIVFYSGKLYFFRLMADGSLSDIHSVVAKKGGSVSKPTKLFEEYTKKMEEIRKEKETELKVITNKKKAEIAQQKANIAAKAKAEAKAKTESKPVKTVSSSGSKSNQVTQQPVKQASYGKDNNIEMSFSYAYNNDQAFHFGVIWDKKTGENRVFYSNDIYKYDFKGSASLVVPKSEILAIADQRGDIMMKAQAYYQQDQDNKQGTEVFVWNTYTGKYLIFYYNKGFLVWKKSLENSEYMAEGGKIMYDYEIDYAQGISGYDPEKDFLVWNTLTGKNNKVERGENPFPSFNASNDGEVMMDFDLGIESTYNSRGGWIYAYTTKTLKRNGYSTYSGQQGYTGYGREDEYTQSYDIKDGENSFDMQVNIGSMYQYKSNGIKQPQMIILNKKTKTNNVGSGFPKFTKYSTFSLSDYKYSGIVKEGNEIGMFMITNEQKGKLEYWFWDKTTGHFTMALYSKTNGSSEFVTPFAVYGNLLTTPVGTSPNMSGGELSAVQLEAGTKPAKTTASASSSSSSTTSEEYYYLKNTTNKAIKVSVNEGLSNHVGAESTFKIKCGSSVAIMYLDGSSWKIGNQISSGKGVCGETVKY